MFCIHVYTYPCQCVHLFWALCFSATPRAAQPRGACSPTCAIGGDSPEFQISNCLYDLKVPDYVEALGVGYFFSTVATLSAVRTGVVHI